MKKLIVIATDKELKNKNLDILYTGIGKINAAIMLTSLLKGLQLVNKKNMPDLIINYGTAGSRNLEIGTLVDCTRFFQRDMDVMPITGFLGETPFEKHIPITLDFSRDNNPIGKHLLCGTGDNFVIDHKSGLDTIIDVFDMEAYALAKVCWLYKIKFISYKYITDNVNEKSAKNWIENCADGATLFKDLLKNLD